MKLKGPETQQHPRRQLTADLRVTCWANMIYSNFPAGSVVQSFTPTAPSVTRMNCSKSFSLKKLSVLFTPMRNVQILLKAVPAFSPKCPNWDWRYFDTLDLNEWKNMYASSMACHDLINDQRTKSMIDLFCVKMDWEIISWFLYFILWEAESWPPSDNNQ